MIRPSTSNEDRIATRAALRYLARYAITRWELRKWLKRKGYSSDCIRRVVRYCGKYHYLNDASVIRSRIRNAQRKGYGIAWVRADLRKRGLPQKWIDRALSKWYPEEREWTVFVRWIKKLPPDLTRVTVMRRARGRGFRPELVSRTQEVYPHEQL